MANPILQQLTAEIARNKEVDDSALALINGFAARLQTAIDNALANGATAAELEPIVAEVAAFKASNQALADAVIANTPAA